jgi:hypothetical protein
MMRARYAVVRVSDLKRYGLLIAMLCLAATLLSAIWHIPYIYTAVAFAAWMLLGHLVTIDDDLPGGWSNPDGRSRFPMRELAVKILILLALVGVSLFLPAIRSLGR